MSKYPEINCPRCGRLHHARKCWHCLAEIHNAEEHHPLDLDEELDLCERENARYRAREQSLTSTSPTASTSWIVKEVARHFLTEITAVSKGRGT